jgi:hypothetical protein
LANIGWQTPVGKRRLAKGGWQKAAGRELLAWLALDSAFSKSKQICHLDRRIRGIANPQWRDLHWFSLRATRKMQVSPLRRPMKPDGSGRDDKFMAVPNLWRLPASAIQRQKTRACTTSQ